MRNLEMRTVKYTELEKEFIDLLKMKSLIPIIGSGFTRFCNCYGGKVPSGSDMKNYMIQKLLSINFSNQEKLNSIPFSKVAFYYNKKIPDTQRKRYLRNNFTDVQISDDRVSFLSVDWKYIYTLNIDDGIEKNSVYTTVIAPMRDFTKELTDTEHCVIKVHGDAMEMYKYANGESLSVFGLDQYIRSLKTNKFILNRLRHDYAYDNIIFVGCSLDDEVDLMKTCLEVIDEENNDNTTCSTIKHRYYVTDSPISDTQECDLESYGIDTIVLVDNYNDFYAKFAYYNEEAKRIPPEQIDLHSHIKFKFDLVDRDTNKDYFFHGKKLYNPETNTIFFPTFFIERKVFTILQESANTYSITLLCGTRVSGKSYALAYLAYKIHDRIVFYFDSRSNIYKDDLNNLINREHVTLIFDTNVLGKNSVKNLITNYNILLQKNIHVVIAVNRSDRDILDYIEAQEDNKIHIVNIQNKFCDEEFTNLNKRLAKIPLIPFQKSTLTILDNLLLCAHYALEQHEIKTNQIQIKDEYILSIYIMLATYEKIDDQQLVDLHLVKESALILQNKNQEIEDYYLFPYERSLFNNSLHRIVCNAQFWLVNQLREYAEISSHQETINSSYKILVQTILENALSKAKGFKEVEELIKFDNVEMIFSSSKNNARMTMQNIYESLSTILSESYQYHHQYAKCLLWSQNDSKETLLLALNHAQVALQQVQELKNKKRIIEANHPLNISEAHIRFTISMIYAILCDRDNFKNNESIENVIDAMYEMVGSQFNHYAISKIRNSSETHPVKKVFLWLLNLNNSYDFSSHNMKSKAEVIINTIMSLNNRRL